MERKEEEELARRDEEEAVLVELEAQAEVRRLNREKKIEKDKRKALRATKAQDKIVQRERRVQVLAMSGVQQRDSLVEYLNHFNGPLASIQLHKLGYRSESKKKNDLETNLIAYS